MYYILYPFLEEPICSDMPISVALVCLYLEKQKIRPFPIRFSYFDSQIPQIDRLHKKDQIIILGDSYPEFWIESFKKFTANVAAIKQEANKTLSQKVWEIFYPLQDQPEVLKILKPIELGCSELPDRMRVEDNSENAGFCKIISHWLLEDTYEFSDIEAAKYIIEKFQKSSIRRGVRNLGNKMLKLKQNRIKSLSGKSQNSPNVINLESYDDELFYPILYDFLVEKRHIEFFTICLSDGFILEFFEGQFRIY